MGLVLIENQADHPAYIALPVVITDIDRSYQFKIQQMMMIVDSTVYSSV